MSEERDIECMLRAAGVRQNPSGEMQAAVRAAVRAEWQATVRRLRWRRQAWFAAAAALAIAMIGGLISLSWPGVSGERVASVSRSIGTVQVRQGYWRRSIPVMRGQNVHAGQLLATGREGRVALQLPSGVSLRLDGNTRVSLIDAGRFAIHQGALYVDAGANPLNPLQIETPAGTVRHLGTQYEVRLVGDDTRVRVREGRVEVRSSEGVAFSAGPGEQLLFSGIAEVRRSRINTYGSDWSWASNAAPPFDTDGRRLSEFLRWVGRELGRDIVFATPESEAEAARTRLSGSLPELSPTQAFAAVLRTTRLRSHEREGRIVIELDDAPR